MQITREESLQPDDTLVSGGRKLPGITLCIILFAV